MFLPRNTIKTIALWYDNTHVIIMVCSHLKGTDDANHNDTDSSTLLPEFLRSNGANSSLMEPSGNQSATFNTSNIFSHLVCLKT